MTDPYYIRIEDPAEFRKGILQSSKSVIMSLKDYHTIISIRKNKLALMEILKEQIKEVSFLFEKLDGALPDKKIKYEREMYEASIKNVMEKKKELKEVPKIEKPKEKEKPKEDDHMSDVDKLQDALANIEQKLNKL
ncbi:MAG: hypothetical protein KKG59_07765 [Nanoarchaeota archaeon]|nr:hypothetical protein [Nanoarchaeota archaeon]